MPSIYDFKLKGLKRQVVDLGEYRGKHMMLVNVASACGYTPQYEDLQTIHELYGDRLAVIGFPSNDFGSQEPGTDEAIADFCKKNYAVSFPMSTKIKVIGDDAHPLYQWLASKSQPPSWNFCKFLIGKEGHVSDFFPASTNPAEIIGKFTEAK